MAVNPKNGQNLVVAAMLFRRDGRGDSTCTVLSSGDEGVTWRRSTLPTSEGLTGGGDPWVAFDDAGVVYLSCLHGAVTGSGERTSAVAVYRSEDGGVTWSAPVRLPGRSYDRPVLVVGKGGASGGSLLHVVVSQSARRDFGAANPISVSTSTDGGRTFGEPVQILPNNLNNNVRSAAVLADGSLLAVFFDIGTLTGGGLLNQFRIWTIRSRDQGRTFGPSLFVNENAGGDQVDIAVDARNGLFAVWDVVRGEAAGRGVFFARSDNGGHSWSKAMRLAPPASGPKHQHVRRSPCKMMAYWARCGWTTGTTRAGSAQRCTSAPRWTRGRPGRPTAWSRPSRRARAHPRTSSRARTAGRKTSPAAGRKAATITAWSPARRDDSTQPGATVRRACSRFTSRP
jgi:hypothetical protein